MPWKIATMIGMGVVMLMLFFQNGRLHSANGKLEERLRLAQETNEQSARLIASLEEANAEWAEDCRLREQELEVMVAQLENDYAELERRKSEVRYVRQEVFRKPGCDELGALSIAAACPELYDSLRNEAARLSCAARGDSTGTCENPDT